MKKKEAPGAKGKGKKGKEVVEPTFWDVTKEEVLECQASLQAAAETIDFVLDGLEGALYEKAIQSVTVPHGINVALSLCLHRVEVELHEKDD